MTKYNLKKLIRANNILKRINLNKVRYDHKITDKEPLLKEINTFYDKSNNELRRCF